MTVFNPSYPQIKNEIIQAQGEALALLVSYIEKLKEVDTLKERAKEEESIKREINNLFL